MTSKILALSKADYLRLTSMLNSDLATSILSDQQQQEWSVRLHKSRIIDPEEDKRLIVMDSIVQLLDLDTGLRESFKLVFPEEADIRARKLSVLAPLGELLLGRRIGDGIGWPTAAGVRRLCIDSMFRLQDPGAVYKSRDVMGDRQKCDWRLR